MKQHRTETIPEEPKSRKHGSVRKLGRAADKALLGMTAEGMSPTSMTHVIHIAQALGKRGNAAESLGRATGHQEYKGDLRAADVLVSQPMTDGTTEELTHIVFVGASALGVSRTVERDGSIGKMRLALMPVGGNRFKGEPVAKDLLVADTSELLDAPGSLGMHSVIVTRSMLTEAGGHTDPSLDENQALVSFTANADLEIQDIGDRGDGSFNGIEIMTIEDIGFVDNRALDDDAHDEAVKFVWTLQENPDFWIAGVEPQN